VLQNFHTKRWGDEDITNDVEVLVAAIEAKLLDMTTFDRFKQELLSGQLEWSPPHKSEKFWRENVSQFNANNYELVGVLAALLSSAESLTVAIACHDLGEFARHHPQGKRVVLEFGIKNKILSLIDAQDLQVQQQSLLALQKLMLTNWEFVGKGTTVTSN
jgi:V-type H+-transporting ATPase subunit H